MSATGPPAGPDATISGRRQRADSFNRLEKTLGGVGGGLKNEQHQRSLDREHSDPLSLNQDMVGLSMCATGDLPASTARSDGNLGSLLQ